MNPYLNSHNLKTRQPLLDLSSDDVEFITRFPIKFLEGNFADYIWGGYHLYEMKGLPYDRNARVAAESWEVSGHHKYPSRILMPDGRTFLFMDLLQERQLAASILGESVVKYFGRKFPMLVKFVDVHQHMSVHLHPSAQAAATLGEEDPGKEEVFFILSLHDGAEGALYLGLKEGVTRREFEAAAKNNANLLNLSHKIYLKAGEIFRIPSGVLHCWTGGSIAVEITESSDLTYRLYDFGRQRPMHIQKGFASLDYHCKQGGRLEKECRRIWQPTLIKGLDSVVTHNALKVERLTAGINGNTVKLLNRDTFEVLMGIDGKIELISLNNDWIVHLNKGSSLLIPAKAGDYLARGLDVVDKNRALRISMKIPAPDEK